MLAQRFSIIMLIQSSCSLVLLFALGCGGAPRSTGSTQVQSGEGKQATVVKAQARDKFTEGVTAYTAGQKEQAIELFKAVISEQPNLGSAYFNIGLIYQELGNREKAREWYKQAGEKAKGFVDGLVNIGLIEQESGLASAAMGTFERALSIDEFNPTALLNLAHEARVRKDYAGAISYVRKALLVNSRNVRAYEVLARVYYDMGLQKGKGFFPLARLVCLSGLEHDEKSARLHNTLGLVYLGMDDVRAALGAFEAAIASDPSFAPAHLNIGAVTFRYRDYQTSYRHFSSALSSEPGNLEAMLSKAVLSRALGRLDEAEQGYRSILSKVSSHIGANFNLGLLYQEHLNKPKQALTQYEKVLSLTQDAELSKQLKQRIQVVKIQLESAQQAQPSAVPDSNTAGDGV